MRKMLSQQGIPPCTPPHRCGKKPVYYSKRQKEWRRIATRYDRWAQVFRCGILLAATVFFW